MLYTYTMIKSKNLQDSYEMSTKFLYDYIILCSGVQNNNFGSSYQKFLKFIFRNKVF